MWNIILKQIIRERKSNAWIFAELFVVSVLLWYCVDFMYVAVRKNIEPKGFDVEHVYRIKIGYNPSVAVSEEADSLEAEWINPFLEVVRRVKTYPGVEAVTYYTGSEPYDPNAIIQGYSAGEGQSGTIALTRYVDENYHKVFRLDLKEGGFSDWLFGNSPLSAVVSEDLADSLFSSSRSVLGNPFFDYYEPALTYTVAGVSGKIKYDVYSRYGKFIHVPLNRTRFKYTVPHIALRVRPEADHSLFAPQFINEMRSKLNVGPFYLFDMISFDYKAELYDISEGISGYMRSISAILLFFLFIVFLGVIGTFRFRIESRRGDIGLRMAIGSSRRQILGITLAESLLLLALAFAPAFAVCANLAFFDITYTYNDAMDYTPFRFWITIVLTFLVMAVMVMCGALIPARRASKLHPVEALREE